jgi:hypothetical protein
VRKQQQRKPRRRVGQNRRLRSALHVRNDAARRQQIIGDAGCPASSDSRRGPRTERVRPA